MDASPALRACGACSGHPSGPPGVGIVQGSWLAFMAMVRHGRPQGAELACPLHHEVELVRGVYGGAGYAGFGAQSERA
jgi:hypothetical protein